MPTNPFTTVFAEQAIDELNALRRFDQQKVIEAIDTHLRYEPTKVSRSRIKQMSQPFWSQYRLRVDEFRVYYDVDEGARSVRILRILEIGREQTAGDAKP
jgi:mRNA-degrading endonuclease RelE of RelBE toxin-antitoxin system